MSRKTGFVGVRLEAELKRKIEAQAKKIGVTPAEIMRLAIEYVVTNDLALKQQHEAETLLRDLKRRKTQLDREYKKLQKEHEAFIARVEAQLRKEGK